MPRVDRRRFLQLAVCGTLALAGCGGGSVVSGAGVVVSGRAAAPGPSTSPLAARLQAIIDSRASDAGVPGIVLATDSRKGQFAGAAGKAYLDGRAMTIDTQIRLASATKTMTAALVMQLVEEGRLRITDTLGQWLPDVVPNASIITIAQLLNHTSGVYDHENDPGLDLLSPSNFGKTWTADEILAFARAHGPDFTPGTEWRYSNTGYYLLGLLVETVTASTVEAEMARRFFTPLHMTRTAVRRDGSLSAPGTGGYCLTPDNRFLDMTGWNMSWDFTAGCGASVALDMITWGKALFGGHVLQPPTLSAMTTPLGRAADLKPGMGCGYGVFRYHSDPYLGELCWEHGGMNGGTHVEWRYYPNRDLALFVGLNRADYNPAGIDAHALMVSLLEEVVPLAA